MQVEPRIKIDDPELPEDLASLARQLQGEADELAECYPAGQIHPVLKEVLAVQLKEHDRSRRVRSRIVAAMAPVLILFGSGALLFLVQPGYRTNQTHAPQSLTSSKQEAVTQPLVGGSVLAVSAPKKDEDVVAAPADREWSGPELEGLIDIWDQDKTVVRRVSF